jgi:hypothetical protein
MAAPYIDQAQGVWPVTLKSTSTCAAGDLIGFDGTDWVKADADGRISAEGVAMFGQSTAGGVVHLARAGVLTDTDAPFTAGSDLYLSATAGAMTHTIPAVSTTLTVLQKIGRAISTSVVQFNCARSGPVLMRVRAATDPASGNTDTTQNLALTVTGVLATDYARFASAPAVVAGVNYNGSIVCTTDTITVGIANDSAGTVNGASVNNDFIVERF